MTNLLNAMREHDEVGTISMFESHELSAEAIDTLCATNEGSHGGSRFILDFGDVVLKLPFSYDEDFELGECDTLLDVFENGREGFDQMMTEWLVWETCPDPYRELLCPILDYGFLENGVPYTVMKKAKTFCEHGDDPEESIYHSGRSGISRPSYANESGSWYQNGMELEEFLEYNGVDMDEFNMDDVEDLCESCHISDGDFTGNFSNLGEIDGKVVLIDYGWGLDRWGQDNLERMSIEDVLQHQQVVY